MANRTIILLGQLEKAASSQGSINKNPADSK